MNTAGEQDTKTLNWVKSELDETLSQARQALEVYVGNPHDEAQLRFVATHLHQAMGTLQIVELYGAALLAEEMESVVNDLLNKQIKQKEDAYEVLMRGILQLPAYLDHLLHGHKDVPITLLPLLNDLRATRGQNLLSENSLFSPDLSIQPESKTEKPAPIVGDLKQFARKLRPIYQIGLVGLLRSNDVHNNLKRIATVIRQLEQNAYEDQTRQLWWISGGLIEALYEQGIEATTSVRSLLGQIDRQLKKMVDGGEQALVQNIPKELLKNLLYYVAQTKSSGKRVVELKQAFHLEKLLPSQNEIDHAKSELLGFNADVIQNVSTAIKDDLLSIKDNLDLFVRAKDRPVAELAPLAERLRVVSDTLGILGLGKLRNLIQNQEMVVSDIIKNSGNLEDSVVMGIASALLFVESSINDMRLESEQDKAAQTDESVASLLPESEYRQLVNLTITEAKSVLARIKDAIIGFAANPEQSDALEDTPKLINEIKGAFVILSFGRLVDIINSCNKYIVQKLVEEKASPERSELDALADVITGIEFFLENFQEDNFSAKKSLEVAEDALIKLGYPTGSQSQPKEVVEQDKIPAEDDLSTADSSIGDIEIPTLDEDQEQDDTIELSSELEPDGQDSQAGDIPFITEYSNQGETEQFDANTLNFEAEDDLTGIKSDLEEDIDPFQEELTEADVFSGLNEFDLEETTSASSDEADFNKDLIEENLFEAEIEQFPQSTAEESVPDDSGAQSAEEQTEPATSINENAEVQEEEDEVDAEVLEIFLEEAEEEHASIVEHLEKWKSDPSDTDALSTLRRSFHTIKGSGRIVGATDIGEFAWSIENLLNRVIDRTVQTSPELFGLLEESSKVLPALIDQIKGGPRPTDDIQRISDNAFKLAAGESISEPISTEATEEPERSLEQPVVDEASEAPHETIELDEILEQPAQDEAFEIQETLEPEGPIELEAAEEVFVNDSDESIAFAVEEEEQAGEGSPFDPVLLEIFTNETNVHLTAIRNFIDQCRQKSDKCSINDDIVRAVHTLHGSARMALVSDIAEITDHLEKYAKVLLENQTPLQEDSIALFIDSTDAIEEMVGLLSHSDAVLPRKAELIERTSALYEKELAVQKERIAHAVEKSDGLAESEIGFDDIDAELIGIFIKEAEDIFRQTNEVLKSWKTSPENSTLIDELRRSIHTLQGGAKIAKLPHISEVSNVLETLLTRVYEGQIEIDDSQDLVSVVQNAYDWLVESFRLLRDKLPAEPHDQIIVQLNKFVAPASEGATEFDYDELADEILEADQELNEIFIDEAHDILASTEELLQRWIEQPEDVAILEEMQRALHTLKGGARMAKITPVGDLSHSVETLLAGVSAGHLPITSKLIDTIQSSHDWIAQSVEALSRNEDIAPAEHLIKEIEELATQLPAEDASQQESILSDELLLEEGLAEEVPEIDAQEDIVMEDVLEEEFNLDQTEVQETADTPDLEIEDHATTLVDEAFFEPQQVSFESEAIKAGNETFAEHIEDESAYDDDLIDIFLDEATEILGTADELIHTWSKEPANKEIVGELQRALHTLKGGARMAKVSPIGDLSHSIESALESIVEGRSESNNELIDLVQSAYDWLLNAIDQIKANKPVEQATKLVEQIEIAVGLRPRPAEEQLEDTGSATADKLGEEAKSTDNVLANIIEAVEKAEITTPQPEVQEAKARPTGEQVRVSADLLDNLVNYAGEVSIYRSRLDQQLNALGYNLTELDQTIARVQEQLRKFEIEAETQILYRYEGTSASESDNEEFDPLELDRFSYMQQLSRSLLEGMSDLSSIHKLLDNQTRESEILSLQQSRVTNELQEGLMRTRLVPFSNVVPRLRRIIRQTSKELGKQAELQVMGAEGEMDRTVLNRIVPALEHMLRNALDHGIETPDKRSQANKSEIGEIILSFTREGSEIVLKIQDDGGGISLNAIRTKAIERGLMDPDAELSDNEIMQFILESGFSTAEKITQISGRGVGMDVVNTEIKQIGGNLQIFSELGKGTLFIVRLPLTVSVNQALIVNAGEEIYAIPLTTVEGVIRVTPEDLEKLHRETKPYYKYGSRTYQFFHLGSSLGVSELQLPPPGVKVPMILARAGDHRVALQVEAITGRQDVVIKTVGQQISGVKGISGATIMGDGAVVLILDIASIIRSGIAHAAKAVTEHKVDEQEAQIVTIMVVDDSITVRKVTERLLKRHGMEVITAKDGVDALDQLQEQIPDLMLLDIEMPRMDGYELATAIRNDNNLKQIPIIMITSRTGEKHRERAMNIGVNMYMGKPFQETELLENINSILNERE